MKNKYKIVKTDDEDYPYEPKVKFWYFPFLWFRLWFISKGEVFSHQTKTIEGCEDLIKLKKMKGETIKTIG